MPHRFHSPDDPKPFHSSGFAQAAQGESMGASTRETYNQRAQVDRQRQVVDKYQSAHLMQQHMQREPGQLIDIVKPQPYANRPFMSRNDSKSALRRPGERPQSGASGGPQQAAVPPRPQARFVEPPTRGYNPYQ